MVFAQTMMTLRVIMENPGLTRPEIASKIEEKYGKKRDSVEFMFLEDTSESSFLMSRIKTLYCVEEKEDKYYFVYHLYSSVKDENDLTQTLIRNTLEGMESRGELEKYKVP